MAYLSKSKVKQLLDGRPNGVTPEGVITGLVRSGHTVEGLNDDRGMFDSAPLESVDSLGEGVASFGKNVLKSGARLVGNTAKGIANVFNPDLEQNTVANMARLGIGAAANTAETITGNEQLFDAPGEDLARAAGQGFVDRFGDKGIKKTLFEDPVGAVSDATAAIGGVGAIAKGLGKTGGKVATFGSEAVNMANAADPVINAARGVKKLGGLAVRGTERVATEAAGITTGAGQAAFQQALDNPSGVAPAMRGKVDNLQILDEARSALNQLKHNRSNDYTGKLEKLAQSADEVDFAPVLKEKEGLLARFKIKASQADDGKTQYDFSRSDFADPIAEQEVRRVLDTVDQWGTQPDDFMPTMVDQLKKRVDNISVTTGASQAFKTSMKNAIKKTVIDQIPEYKDMLGNYERASNEIDEISKALSLTDRASNDTAIRKLTSIIRQNNEYRLGLVKELEDIAGRDITGKVSGVALSSLTPRGLMRAVTGGAFITGILPAVSLGLTSPRILGEMFVNIGIAKGVANRLARAIVNAVPQSAQVPALEAARISGQSQ